MVHVVFFQHFTLKKLEEKIMPELPEVETTRRDIEDKIIHQTIRKLIIRNPNMRWPVESNLTEKLPGLSIQEVNRRAKYLLLKTAKGHLIIHLGMSGYLRVLEENTPPQKHDHIDLILENGHLLRLHDPRRFGAFLWTEDAPENHPLLNHLGPEPLTEAFKGDTLFRASRNRTVALKTFIMNNDIVVGVGNIYANESLFLSGLNPKKPAKKLTQKQADLLAKNIKKVLKQAIETGGTTLKDFLTPDGTPGYFEQKLNVYGRDGKPCRICQTTIERLVQNQRATYFCPRCQSK